MLRAVEIAARRAIVVEPQTDEILLEKNADVRGEVASTQKLLTALIIARDGELDARVSILAEDFPDDASCLPVQLGFAPNETYTRRELLIGMLVGSANEAARALARDSVGNLAVFAERMNDVAVDLGMADSRFFNPTGLPDDRQFSTPRDLATLAKAIDSTALLREIVRMKRFCLHKRDGTAIECANTNRLLQHFSMCDGMKTGFTRSAGYCLVGSGEIKGRRRLVVVLNCARDEVWADSQKLLEAECLGDVERVRASLRR